jgi:glycosyltransferase involved in cell wall biosynthesis
MTNYKLKKPILSVYMPVFNAAPYLPQAIDSILSQNCSRFEFIIVDDASTDSSWKIIKKYAKKDPRIRPFKNKINLGVSLTSNIAISLARGKYVARMDADDISAPDRLQKQLSYLKKHPQTILIGGQCTIINPENQITGYKSFPTSLSQINDMLFWAVPIQQGYMMLNRSLLPKNFQFYSASKSSAEEIDLYFNLAKYGRFANLTDNLYFYRQVPLSLSRINPKKTFWLTLQSRFNAVKNGYQPSLFALFLNLAQIFIILILPSKLIYSLWYFIRGVTRPQLQTQILPDYSR